MAKNSCQKKPNFSEILANKSHSILMLQKFISFNIFFSERFKWFLASKIIRIFLRKNSLVNINLGAHFLLISILCSIKIEWLLFLKFLKILAFFDSNFWPFYKSEEKIKVIFVISAIWNVFIKFRWHVEKLTTGLHKSIHLY